MILKVRSALPAISGEGLQGAGLQKQFGGFLATPPNRVLKSDEIRMQQAFGGNLMLFWPLARFCKPALAHSPAANPPPDCGLDDLAGPFIFGDVQTDDFRRFSQMFYMRKVCENIF